MRAAVRSEWQASVRRRAIRRRALAATALLATAAVIVFAVQMTAPRRVIETPSTVTQIVGAIERIDGRANGFSAGTAVRIGDSIETDSTSRAALRLPDGTSVRFDVMSRARFVSPVVLELSQGAVYVDTGRESTGLEIRTPLGIARDIGTQFEVRLQDEALRVRVRTGVVELKRGDHTVPARAGTELRIVNGEPESRAIPTHGSEWDWAAALATPFTIEGRPLSTFLDHLAREQGWTVRYADATLARDASSTILHGSVAGLLPREALDVALTTSGLEHRFHDGELLISRGMK